MYPMLCNSASGAASGEHQSRLSGRPSAGRRADFEALPIGIWPKCNPETRFPGYPVPQPRQACDYNPRQPLCPLSCYQATRTSLGWFGGRSFNQGLNQAPKRHINEWHIKELFWDPGSSENRPKPFGNQLWEVALRRGSGAKASNPVSGKYLLMFVFSGP